MSRNPLGPDGVKLLASALAWTPHIQKLGSARSASGRTLLTGGLPARLQETNMQDDGAKALAQLLQANTSLVEL